MRIPGKQCLQHPGRSTAVLFTLAVLLAACTSTTSSPTTTSGSSGGGSGSATAGIPTSAFSDTTGVTSHSVTIGNVSTQLLGLFKGAFVGTQAYAAYVNSTGGVNGRKIVVQGYDDGYTGALNKQYTELALQNTFAAVGSFSVQDSFGGTVIAANPGFPDVSTATDPTTEQLPNVYSALPAGEPGYPLGSLTYFKANFPKQILHTGTIIADQPSTETLWAHEKAAMEHLGYKVLYDPALPVTTSDFTPQVVAMKQAGVQIIFMDQAPVAYASALLRDLNEQNFHPVIVLGAASYSEKLVPDSGGASNVNGAYLQQQASLYLGEDASKIPAVTTFNTWMHKADPSFAPDFFSLVGWVDTELFVDALRAAGSHPTRGSVLEALRHITSFSSGNLIPTSNPGQRVPITCYLIGKVQNGSFVRHDDPPVSGTTHGYRCDAGYYSES
jgi:ABC-type branched-subunit amino acid transport system substrate-binding protein